MTHKVQSDTFLDLCCAVKDGPAGKSGTTKVSTVAVGDTLSLNSVHSAAETLVKGSSSKKLAGFGGVLGLYTKSDLLVSKGDVNSLGVGETRGFVAVGVGEVSLLGGEDGGSTVATAPLLLLSSIPAVHAGPDKLITHSRLGIGLISTTKDHQIALLCEANNNSISCGEENTERQGGGWSDATLRPHRKNFRPRRGVPRGVGACLKLSE